MLWQMETEPAPVYSPPCFDKIVFRPSWAEIAYKSYCVMCARLGITPAVYIRWRAFTDLRNHPRNVRSSF